MPTLIEYDRWSWDELTGSGPPTGFAPKRIAPILKQDKDAGYTQTRPQFTRKHWLYRVEWAEDHITPWSFLYIIDFLDGHSGQIFEMQWPVGVPGMPQNVAPGSPWETEDEPGEGGGPIHLVRYLLDDVPLKRSKLPGWYQTESPLEFVQV